MKTETKEAMKGFKLAESQALVQGSRVSRQLMRKFRVKPAKKLDKVSYKTIGKTNIEYYGALDLRGQPFNLRPGIYANAPFCIEGVAFKLHVVEVKPVWKIVTFSKYLGEPFVRDLADLAVARFLLGRANVETDPWVVYARPEAADEAMVAERRVVDLDCLWSDAEIGRTIERLKSH